MARIDRQRFDAAKFPVIIQVPTRYDDLDPQGHVNNAAAIAILQEARVRFNEVAGLPLLLAGPFRALVAAVTVEYAAELHHPDAVEVHSGIVAIGRSSLTIAQVARQNGTSAIYAQVVVVIANETGPVSVPDELRAAYARLMLV